VSIALGVVFFLTAVMISVKADAVFRVEGWENHENNAVSHNLELGDFQVSEPDDRLYAVHSNENSRVFSTTTRSRDRVGFTGWAAQGPIANPEPVTLLLLGTGLVGLGAAARTIKRFKE